jgi:DNA-binding transcriptional MocR family regulator
VFKVLGDEDSMAIVNALSAVGMVGVPGRVAAANGEEGQCIRLSYSHAPPEQLKNGITRMAVALRALRNADGDGNDGRSK